MQENAAVAAHRAGNVAQHDQRRRAPAPAAPLQLDEPARAQRRAQSCAQIGAGAAAVRCETPGRDVLHRQAQPGDRRLGTGQLFERHLLEIHAAQLLAVGEAHRRVDLGLGLLGFALFADIRVERLREAPHHRRALVLGTVDPHFRQHEPHHLFQKIRVAPEDVKRLVEDQPLVRPIDEHGVEGPVEIPPIGDADRPDRGHRVDDLARPDRQPRRAQSTREVHQIGEQPAVLGSGVPLTLPLTRVPPSPRARGEGRGEGRARHDLTPPPPRPRPLLDRGCGRLRCRAGGRCRPGI